MTWTSKPPPKTGRARKCDTIDMGRNRTEIPGTLRGEGRQIKSIRDAFNLLFSLAMITLIVQKTNTKIELVLSQISPALLQNNKYCYLRKTDEAEVYALIGLMYCRALLGQSRHRVNYLYSSAGHPIFAATMSRDRMKWLMHNLSFDTEAERAAAWPNDRFAAMRTFFEMWNDRLPLYVIPTAFLALDETLSGMRHQIEFKMFNPSKPARYGCLFKSVNETAFPYTYRVIIYKLCIDLAISVFELFKIK